ncbi:MAG: hypothetical protein CMB80_14690, partial [Flammeovirgaceae bacterium]|nr:hypothetical protein [Flammeovirgaceae bacterium]
MNTIRYKNILMKKTEREGYESYSKSMEGIYRRGNVPSRTRKSYYHLDDEYRKIGILVEESKQELDGYRNFLLYQETIAEEDQIKYKRQKEAYLRLKSQLEKFKGLKDVFYKDTTKSLEDLTQQLRDAKKNMRQFFVLFKSAVEDSDEWKGHVESYVKEKQKIPELYHRIDKLREMLDVPKYYLIGSGGLPKKPAEEETTKMPKMVSQSDPETSPSEESSSSSSLPSPEPKPKSKPKSKPVPKKKKMVIVQDDDTSSSGWTPET